ncbi:MAG: DedA family protein [Ignavibacteriales bacterium]|nr:DedA family protein [Ignavibacteriales bacterium]
MESFFSTISLLNPYWIYGVLFVLAYIENIFPPSPSDVMLVFGGSLVGMGKIAFVPALLSSTAGSTLGFVTMYIVGDWFGLAIIEKKKIGFLPLEAIHKVEAWFQRYGYWIIVANRFMSGTRAVISFFAGMSELRLGKTTVLCFASALVWNVILLYAGTLLGENWRSIGDYLSLYSRWITGILIGAATVWLVVWLNRRRKSP